MWNRHMGSDRSGEWKMTIRAEMNWVVRAVLATSFALALMASPPIARAALNIALSSAIPLNTLFVGDTFTVDVTISATAPETTGLGMRADGGTGLTAMGTFTAPASIFNFSPSVPFGGIANTPALLGLSADGTVNLFQGVSLSAAAGAGPDSFSVEFTATTEGAGTITVGQVAGHPEDVYLGGDNVYNNGTLAYSVIDPFYVSSALNTNASTDTGSDIFTGIETDGLGNWVSVWRSTEDLGGTIGSETDIFTARSSDNGVTWTDPAVLNTNASTDTGHEAFPPVVRTDRAGV